MSVSRGSASRFRHARSAIRRAVADLRHAAAGLRRVALDLRNAALEIARAVYAVLLAALPAAAEVALRQAGARSPFRRRRFEAPQPRPDVRPVPKVVVPVPNRALPTSQDGAPDGPSDGAPEGATTLLLVLGADPEGLRDIINEAEELAATVGVRPMFVTDSDAFGAFRDRGWLFEYLPPRKEWQRLDRHGTGYDTFVHARIAELAEVYRPDRVVSVVGRGQLSRLTGLLAGSASPGHAG